MAQGGVIVHYEMFVSGQVCVVEAYMGPCWPRIPV